MIDKIISLFSGCGGLDLGFEQAGFDVVWANEYDSKIENTHHYNHPETELDTRSIVDVKSDEIPFCDGIIGGPPCQSWSLAGSMGGIDDNRGQLFYEYARILRDKMPKFFLAENVPGIISKRHIDEFKKIVNLFEKIGYEVTYKKVDSADYGVPQNRKRVIIVGFRKDLGIKFDFPEKTHSDSNEDKPNIVKLKDALKDLPEPKPSKEKNYTNENLKINAHEYYTGSFSSRFMSRNRRRGWDEPAYTVEASGRHAKIHPDSPQMVKLEKDKREFKGKGEPRRLSIRESARIQTFPDIFKFFYEKLNDGYKMVGNAVPVKLAEVLATEIYYDLCQLSGKKDENIQRRMGINENGEKRKMAGGKKEELKMKLIEKIADSIHNAWWNEKKEQGFHSPKKCPYAIDSYVQGSFDKFKKNCEKCHTDMYPYNELPENIKEYDRVTAKAVLKSLEENDYSVIKDEDIPDTATGTFIGDDSEWRRY